MDSGWTFKANESREAPRAGGGGGDQLSKIFGMFVTLIDGPVSSSIGL